jgi:hypothetical protein
VTLSNTYATIKRIKYMTFYDDKGSLKHYKQVGRQVASCDRQSASESLSKLKLSLLNQRIKANLFALKKTVYASPARNSLNMSLRLKGIRWKKPWNVLNSSRKTRTAYLNC